MLWGASLAAGAEAFRRYENRDEAIVAAIKTTQLLMESFSKRAGSIDCMDLTTCDFESKLSMFKFFITGKFLSCFKLIGDWFPEAIQAVSDGFSQKPFAMPAPVSCTSEVVRRSGATDREMVMVAGFAGGLGLSGNACGALSAAIWMKTLAWCKETPGKYGYPNPGAEKALKNFYDATGREILCTEITGKRFHSVEEHANFIKNGGCDKVISVLAKS
jgi:hypothetical protein